jgi:hypothetical protein
VGRLRVENELADFIGGWRISPNLVNGGISHSAKDVRFKVSRLALQSE